MAKDPRIAGPRAPFPKQQQVAPGNTATLNPRPDHGEESYRGSSRFAGCAVVVTGGDSGIGRAVTFAFAREGADVPIAYLNEDVDARESAKWVEKAGRRAVLVAGDVSDQSHCQKIIDIAAKEFGRIDVLINNAGLSKAAKAANFGANRPLGRPGQPAEVAPAYVFLASEAANYTTGAVLPVTGGRPML